MSNNETPVQWCRRMADTAPDGEAAYHYFQLAEHWDTRGDDDDADK